MRLSSPLAFFINRPPFAPLCHKLIFFQFQFQIRQVYANSKIVLRYCPLGRTNFFSRDQGFNTGVAKAQVKTVYVCSLFSLTVPLNKMTSFKKKNWCGFCAVVL
jgi:hypothetical protein